MQFKMYRDKSVHKSGLLKKFLNDLNKIDCPKHTVKPRSSLKYEKPKSFALLMRPKHYNRSSIKQQDRNLPNSKRSEPAVSFISPKSSNFEPEINIDGVMVNEEILSKISFQDILTSTQLDKLQNLHGARFEQAEKARHTYKQCLPKVFHEPDEAVQRKTIYDYATDCTITDVNVEEQYTKLMHHVNTNILEKLDPNKLQRTNKRCNNLLEQINQSRKFDLLERCRQAEPTKLEFRTLKNSVNTPTLFNETPSIQMTTTFFNKQSTFFDLERTTGKEEFLWVKPKAVGKKLAAKQIERPKQQHHASNETFFEKRDNDQEFLKFFSMK